MAVNLLLDIRVPNMKNQLSRNFQQTIVLGLPNCQIHNRTVRFAFDSLLGEKHLFGSYRVKLKIAMHRKFSRSSFRLARWYYKYLASCVPSLDC